MVNKRFNKDDYKDVKRVNVQTGFRDEVSAKQSPLSAAIYAAVINDGIIGEKEAKKALLLFEKNCSQQIMSDARNRVNGHKNIERLLDVIESGVPIRANVVSHPKVEELSPEVISIVRRMTSKKNGQEIPTPFYLYFEDSLEKNMKELMQYPAPFGLTVRYAMKANSNAAILKIFDKLGAHIDASSVGEVYRAIQGPAEINPNKIRLTSQEVPNAHDLKYLVGSGVNYTACSLRQLELYGILFPNSKIAIRFNVGIGSGWNNATNTGGVNADFGIYEKHAEIDSLLKKYNLTLDTIHLHIGSGSNPEKQKEAALAGIELAKKYSDVIVLNLGGGIKVGRMNYEKSTDIMDLGKPTAEALRNFYQETRRKIHVEIEPGTRAVANAGVIVASVTDIVDTGDKGYTFIKTDSGMTENARIQFYGAQNPIVVVTDNKKIIVRELIFKGSCCESGDVSTVREGFPEIIEPRRMIMPSIVDKVVTTGTGAYCSSMAPSNYNSHVRAAEYLARKNNGVVDLIRKRQELSDIYKDEVVPLDLK
ncbi:MAG: diaminopimelate decarboxylase [Candidatus Woesearchaeota archaeon]|jgi:diaminopimelate decarboxylase